MKYLFFFFAVPSVWIMGCLQGEDTTTEKEKIVYKTDTVYVTKTDTVRIIATPVTEDLKGAWRNEKHGINFAILSPEYSFQLYKFQITSGSQSYNGAILKIESNIATMDYDLFIDGSISISKNGNSLFCQHIAGSNGFLVGEVIEFKRF